MSKYHSRKVILPNGTTFDSKKEYKRFIDLQWLEKAGEIRDLKTQVTFELIPKQNGERAVKYIADFVYINNKTGETVVEDVKSIVTRKKESYIIKRKLMLYILNIKIKEV